LKDELAQLGLSRNDFLYYRSSLKMLNPTNRRMSMIELTDQTRIENMVEEYNAWQSVELHCYRRPDWFTKPTLPDADHGVVLVEHGAVADDQAPIDVAPAPINVAYAPIPVDPAPIAFAPPPDAVGSAHKNVAVGPSNAQVHAVASQDYHSRFSENPYGEEEIQLTQVNG
jgi:hypothetical protein